MIAGDNCLNSIRVKDEVSKLRGKLASDRLVHDRKLTCGKRSDRWMRLTEALSQHMGRELVRLNVGEGSN